MDTTLTHEHFDRILGRCPRRCDTPCLCKWGCRGRARAIGAAVAACFGAGDADAVRPSRGRGCGARGDDAAVENSARLATGRGAGVNMAVPRCGKFMHRSACANGGGVSLDQITEPADPTASAAGQIQDNARLSALSAALTELPERQAQAVSLRHLEGLSNPDIADIMNISVRSVESLTARGKRALADILRKHKSALGVR